MKRFALSAANDGGGSPDDWLFLDHA